VETFFVMEEKHAISVQNFHEEQTFRDPYAASGHRPRRRCHNFTQCDRVTPFGINRAFQGVAMERRRSLVAAPLAVAALLTAGGAVTATAAAAAPASAPLPTPHR
jgi:hypothetical protein